MIFTQDSEKPVFGQLTKACASNPTYDPIQSRGSVAPGIGIDHMDLIARPKNVAWVPSCGIQKRLLLCALV